MGAVAAAFALGLKYGWGGGVGCLCFPFSWLARVWTRTGVWLASRVWCGFCSYKTWFSGSNLIKEEEFVFPFVVQAAATSERVPRLALWCRCHDHDIDCKSAKLARFEFPQNKRASDELRAPSLPLPTGTCRPAPSLLAAPRRRRRRLPPRLALRPRRCFAPPCGRSGCLCQAGLPAQRW